MGTATMTAVLQLSPPIHVYTPLGEGFARILIDYGPDTNTVFLVDIFATKECKAVDSNDIRFGENYMYGLGKPKLPVESRP